MNSTASHDLFSCVVFDHFWGWGHVTQNLFLLAYVWPFLLCDNKGNGKSFHFSFYSYICLFSYPNSPIYYLHVVLYFPADGNQGLLLFTKDYTIWTKKKKVALICLADSGKSEHNFTDHLPPKCRFATFNINFRDVRIFYLWKNLRNRRLQLICA